MNQEWQKILKELNSRSLSGVDMVEFPGRIELMLVRFQTQPDLEQIDLVIKCLEILPWSEIVPRHDDVHQRCLIRCGRILNLLGDRNRAEEFFLRAIDETSNRFPGMTSIAYMELGDLYRRRGKLEKASIQQNLALSIARKGDLDREKADALNNLALIATEAGRLDEAEKFLTESLGLAEEICEIRLEGHVYNNFGVINCMRGHFDNALSEFSRAIPKREQAGDEKGMSETFHNMSLAYLDSGKMELAEIFARKALDKAHCIQDKGQETHIMLTLTELTMHTRDYAY
ncbi:tetratricopeptide repeat protein, partial [bacterium]|nr:tetratricopeptide repeat protein [bacterium]